MPELFFDELELFFTDGRSTLVRLVWLIDGIVRDLYGGAEWTQVTIMRQQVNQILVRMQIWKDNHGQDLIEYALMAGFVAVSAGAIMPGVASSVKYDLLEGGKRPESGFDPGQLIVDSPTAKNGAGGGTLNASGSQLRVKYHISIIAVLPSGSPL